MGGVYQHTSSRRQSIRSFWLADRPGGPTADFDWLLRNDHGVRDSI